VERDFDAMAARGFNAVRTYTMPPPWLLDAASTHGLHVMAGLPWEQHIAFLDDPRRVRSIHARMRDAVRVVSGHPALLAYAVGNEIPAPIVRWHGRGHIERFLEGLADTVRREDPETLLTYVNYPSTEYLKVPFADFVCFNVYLETTDRLTAYMARLHNLADDRPLILAEIGLDSRRHGLRRQAETAEAQVRAAFGGGCAGVFVFAWTDEWHRGGHDVAGWDFGLTDRARRPKPALVAVQRALEEAPFAHTRWPRVSVVVCSYNGGRTIAQCLESLRNLEYPDYEVIVVDDGSTDATATIAQGYDVNLISTANEGLSSARTTGLARATGEIVAYIDDDAYADPHWLTYLASTFQSTGHVGVGGPNIPPEGDGVTAAAVAAAPGGPIHVLVSDSEAEHLPGCNMAFRKSALQAIGGFDSRFRTAGDDVDVCWRLRDRGWTLGFNPAAVVWHHRRGSVRAYFKQQRGYGRAEALLERKWPDRYNAAGHTTWAGRVYGAAAPLGWGRPRIYHGSWGSALFQSLYQPRHSVSAAIVTMPEWYLLVATLAALTALGGVWRPLLAMLPLLALAVAAPLAVAASAAARARPPIEAASVGGRWRFKALVLLLHVLQPIARLAGRLGHGLSPWRRRGRWPFATPSASQRAVWSERWRPPASRLALIEKTLRNGEYRVRRGGDFDRWDLEASPGILGGARVLATTEEHGAGRQLTRFRSWPRFAGAAIIAVVFLGALTIAAGLDGALSAAAILATAGAAVAWRSLRECGMALAAFGEAIDRLERVEALKAEDLRPAPGASEPAA
jgi:GT2 family glycosyltransferase